MHSRDKIKLAKVAEQWRRTRPLPWRLRSLLNQRRRSRRK